MPWGKDISQNWMFRENRLRLVNPSNGKLTTDIKIGKIFCNVSDDCNSTNGWAPGCGSKHFRNNLFNVHSISATPPAPASSLYDYFARGERPVTKLQDCESFAEIMEDPLMKRSYNSVAGNISVNYMKSDIFMAMLPAESKVLTHAIHNRNIIELEDKIQEFVRYRSACWRTQ